MNDSVLIRKLKDHIKLNKNSLFYGKKLTNIQSKLVSSRNKRKVFKFRLYFADSSNKTLYAKIYPNESILEKEYVSLSLVNSLVNHAYYFTPKVMAIFREMNALLMEEVRGKKYIYKFLVQSLPFLRILFIKQIKKELGKIVEWLNYFEEKTFVKQEKISKKEIEKIKNNLFNLDLNVDDKEIIWKKFMNLLNKVEKLPLIGVHKDFALRNIIIEKWSIAVVDFDKFSYSKFLDSFNCLIINLYQKKIYLLYSENYLSELKTFLIAKYINGSELPINSAILRLTYMINIINHLNNVQKHRSSRHMIERRIFLNELSAIGS